MRFNNKRAKKSGKRAKLLIFTTHFSKFREFGKLHSPKRYAFAEILLDTGAFVFQKGHLGRVPHAVSY